MKVYLPEVTKVLSPVIVVCSEIKKAAIWTIPWENTTSASNGCNQHSLLSVGFNSYQLTDQ